MEYQEQNSLYMLLGEINAKVGAIMDTNQQHRAEMRRELKEIHDRIDGHESRVVAVEKSNWKIMGVATAVPVLISVVAGIIAIIQF